MCQNVKRRRRMFMSTSATAYPQMTNVLGTLCVSWRSHACGRLRKAVLNDSACQQNVIHVEGNLQVLKGRRSGRLCKGLYLSAQSYWSFARTWLVYGFLVILNPVIQVQNWRDFIHVYRINPKWRNLLSSHRSEYPFSG